MLIKGPVLVRGLLAAFPSLCNTDAPSHCRFDCTPSRDYCRLKAGAKESRPSSLLPRKRNSIPIPRNCSNPQPISFDFANWLQRWFSPTMSAANHHRISVCSSRYLGCHHHTRQSRYVLTTPGPDRYPTQTKTFYLKQDGDFFLNISIPSTELEVLFQSMVRAFKETPNDPESNYMFRFAGSFKD